MICSNCDSQFRTTTTTIIKCPHCDDNIEAEYTIEQLESVIKDQQFAMRNLQYENARLLVKLIQMESK